MKHSWLLILLVACRSQTVVMYSTTHHAVLAFDDDHPDATACFQDCQQMGLGSFGRCLATCPDAHAFEGVCTFADRNEHRACGEWADATTETVDADCDELQARGSSRVLSCTKNHTLSIAGKLGIGFAIGVGAVLGVLLQIVANGIKA